MKFIYFLARCAMLFALCVSAQAQQPKKTYRIGILSGVDAATSAGRFEAIPSALAELGYKEGQNIAFERCVAWGKSDPAAERAAELVNCNRWKASKDA